MKLSEVHVALLQAGIETAICDQAAAAMVAHGHVNSWTSYMTSMQVAKMLWLSFICRDEKQISAESNLITEKRNLPAQGGKEDGDTILTFLAQIVRNGRLASNVFTLEIDSNTRTVHVAMRDQAPIDFAMPNSTAQVKSYTLTIAGTFLSRAALAYSSSVWLPYDQQTITHHVKQD